MDEHSCCHWLIIHVDVLIFLVSSKLTLNRSIWMQGIQGKLNTLLTDVSDDKSTRHLQWCQMRNHDEDRFLIQVLLSECWLIGWYNNCSIDEWNHWTEVRDTCTDEPIASSTTSQRQMVDMIDWWVTSPTGEPIEKSRNFWETYIDFTTGNVSSLCNFSHQPVNDPSFKWLIGRHVTLDVTKNRIPHCYSELWMSRALLSTFNSGDEHWRKLQLTISAVTRIPRARAFLFRLSYRANFNQLQKGPTKLENIWRH